MPRKKVPAPISGDYTIPRKITHCKNVDDTDITITESKLENILIKHREALSVGSNWKTPLGLIIAILTVFLTAEFNKNFLGFESSRWETLFIFLLMISFIWLIRSGYLRYTNRNENIEFLIKRIKDEKDNRKISS